MLGRVDRSAVFFSAREVVEIDWVLDLNFANCVFLVLALLVMDFREEKFSPE